MDRPDGDDQDCQVNLLHDGAQAGSKLFVIHLFDFFIVAFFSYSMMVLKQVITRLEKHYLVVRFSAKWGTGFSFALTVQKSHNLKMKNIGHTILR